MKGRSPSTCKTRGGSAGWPDRATVIGRRRGLSGVEGWQDDGTGVTYSVSALTAAFGYGTLAGQANIAASAIASSVSVSAPSRAR